MTKVLLVVSGSDHWTLKDGSKHPTGFWAAEFIHPHTREPASAYVGDLEQLAFQKGLLLLSCGKSTIRFAPPLVVGPHEVQVMLRILEECLTILDDKHQMRAKAPLDEKI